jgi:hypothetical protein
MIYYSLLVSMLTTVTSAVHTQVHTEVIALRTLMIMMVIAITLMTMIVMILMMITVMVVIVTMSVLNQTTRNSDHQQLANASVMLLVAQVMRMSRTAGRKSYVQCFMAFIHTIHDVCIVMLFQIDSLTLQTNR